MEAHVDTELYSNELKKMAGYGKDGEKGFDGAVTNLMMQMYLCNCDFRKRVKKKDWSMVGMWRFTRLRNISMDMIM